MADQTLYRDQRDEFTEPLDLGVPVIEVETSDGYDPPLDVLVAEILRLGGLPDQPW